MLRFHGYEKPAEIRSQGELDEPQPAVDAAPARKSAG
jgi:hypothetical protein